MKITFKLYTTTATLATNEYDTERKALARYLDVLSEPTVFVDVKLYGSLSDKGQNLKQAIESYYKA